MPCTISEDAKSESVHRVRNMDELGACLRGSGLGLELGRRCPRTSWSSPSEERNAFFARAGRVMGEEFSSQFLVGGVELRTVINIGVVNV